MKIKTFNKLILASISITLIYFVVSMISACTVENKVVPTASQAAQMPLVSLSWEKDHPERLVWSQFIYKRLANDLFNTFDQAKDNTRLCKKYNTLTLEQRATVWAELISQMSYYESSWNPKSASVDVGQSDKRDTWSVGLMQISVTDQWGSIEKVYKYDDLLKPIENLDLSLKIMERQIKTTGKIILLNSDKMRYWAVLLDGNKYSKVDKITAKTQALPFCGG